MIARIIGMIEGTKTSNNAQEYSAEHSIHRKLRLFPGKRELAWCLKTRLVYMPPTPLAMTMIAVATALFASPLILFAEVEDCEAFLDFVACVPACDDVQKSGI